MPNPEDRGDIWLEKHDVGAGLKSLMVLPVYAIRKIVLGPHLVATLCLDVCDS
jgi:hypothetical protein